MLVTKLVRGGEKIIMEDKIESMGKKVGSVQRLLQESEKARKQTSAIRTLFAIGIVVVVVAYVWGMWTSAKERFESAKIIPIVQQQVQALLPEFNEAGRKVIKNVMPVYGEVFAGKVAKMGPALQKQTDDELKTFSLYLKAEIEPKLTKGFDNIIEDQMTIVMKRLPGLNEENSAKILNNVVSASNKHITNLIAEKLLREHIVTLDEIYEILKGFDVSDVEISEQTLNEMQESLLDFVIEQLKAQVATL